MLQFDNNKWDIKKADIKFYLFSFVTFNNLIIIMSQEVTINPLSCKLLKTYLCGAMT